MSNIQKLIVNDMNIVEMTTGSLTLKSIKSINHLIHRFGLI